MPRLVQKSGYVKAARAGGYMKYIATREGVEKLERTGYMEYIATRPNVERHGEHGLFSSDESVDLQAALDELGAHLGNVWTLIYSLKREDAARLGYDNAAAWRNLIMAHQADFAEAMKIPADKLRWYAAFHDQGEHPHIHMMLWSDDPKQGFLTKQGIEVMRSKLTNDIFRDELLNLYQRKDVLYKELTRTAQRAMTDLLHKMENQICDSPVIGLRMPELAQKLKTVGGKKQYGYLKKPLKVLVDSIVDELAGVPEVTQCYEVWNGLRDELENFYHEKKRERLPLSQQKEFWAIKNMIIKEAENLRLGVHTFEDKGMNDEPDKDVWDGDCIEARDVIYAEDSLMEDKMRAVELLERCWERGLTKAARLLGRLYKDGREVYQDPEKAELWLRRAAGAGDDQAGYSLSKLLLSQGRTAEALPWLEWCANQGNQYAKYQMGKLCLRGEVVPKDVAKAVQYFTDSAEQGNQFAQYALGKLYLQGREVEQNIGTAQFWLSQAASQGNQYAQFLLEHSHQQQKFDPSVLLAATHLLHHMSNIFRENSVPPANPAGLRIDSQRRKQLMEKRIAMGHKPDDHEVYQGPTMAM